MSAVEAPSRATPVMPGLLRLEPEPCLLGSHCSDCGSTFFPRRTFCRNPRCARGPLRDVDLSRGGQLYSYTVQHYLPPEPFRLDRDLLPYGIGLVELPEGLRVLGMVHEDVPLDQLRIGMPMMVRAGRLYRGDTGDVVTWKFAPSDMRSGS